MTIHRPVTPVTLAFISFTVVFRPFGEGPAGPGRLWGMRLPRTRPRSLAGQLFAMQVVLIAAVVAGCAVFAYVSGSAQAEETAERQVRVAALAVADSPSVREAIRTPDPSAVLQPYAERVREDTGIAFVTIMDPRRVRWTHPDTRQIGDTFLGNTARALRGETFTETYTGTLGPSIRVVTPILDEGRIVGLVSAGITVDRVSSQVREQLGALAMAAGGALALGGIGTYVVNARLRRHTHGMNAAELSRLHDYHQATLHAVREGLLMLDGRRRIALINDAGRELLGLGPEAEAVGRTVDELALPAPLTGALLASEARVDELHLTAERVVVVNTRPVVGGERRGTVVTCGTTPSCRRSPASWTPSAGRAGAALAGARGGEPAAHGGLADRAGPGGGGRGVRDGGA
ncbi:hypothetical protein SCALM49S_09340 [Streptomyces californicus]